MSATPVTVYAVLWRRDGLQVDVFHALPDAEAFACERRRELVFRRSQFDRAESVRVVQTELR